MTRWMLILGISAVAGGLAAAVATGQIDAPALGAKHEKPAATSEVVTPLVTVIRPKTHGFVETVLVTGSLVPRREILIAPQIEGQRIRELSAEVGDRVRQGQVLARLVTDNLETRMAQNAAQVARADASIARARSAIVDAKARHEEAASALKRAKPLRRQGAVSQSVFEQRQAAERSTKAQVAVAENELRVADSDKARAQAERRELQWQMDRAEIISPVDGLIMRRDAKIGAIASGQGAPMFRIIQRGEIELAGELTVADLAKLKPGQKARLTVGGAAAYEAVVRLVSPEVDAASRLGEVRLLIGDKPGLRVGAFGRGTIETARSRGLAVPASAIMSDPDGRYVHTVTDGKVVTRRVETGLTADERVEVTKGLSPEDLVIAKAGTFLREGDAVRPVEASAAARLSEAR